MKKALVTGGAGFIGANLVKKLLQKGWLVTVVDNLYRPGSINNLKWLKENFKTTRLTVLNIDIRDYPEIKPQIAKVEVVFHLAAQTAVTTSFLNPREDFEINTVGSFNVLEAAREAGHKPIVIFASTNKVYGAMERLKTKIAGKRYVYSGKITSIDDLYPLDFHSPYGCSNGAADQYTRDYFRAFQIPTVIFRQSCIYGPRQMSIEAQGWVVYLALAFLLNRPINIFGTGKQVRDILYVNDLVSAYLLAVKHIKKAVGKVFNIGGGEKNSLSILEYINLLEKMFGKKVLINFKPKRPGDQKIFIADNNKLKKFFSWRPQVGYKEGITKTIAWLKKHQDWFK